MGTDRVSVEVRSANMAKVKSKNTKPELKVRSLLHKAGLRFRIHREDLPGHPDIVLPKYKTIIFINGCFWHQHPGCKRATIPNQNADSWISKLEKNQLRDQRNKDVLINMGWNVLVVWECDIRRDIDSVIDEILSIIGRKERND